MAARHHYESKGYVITDLQENTEWGGKILDERGDLTL
jgi:hypothetical protein